MTDINNGNTPAQPTPYLDCENGSGELHCDNTGLTKREHFASLSPNEIPKWFLMLWIKTPESQNEKYHWHRKADEFNTIAESGLTDEGEAAMYFAWKVYHADALLKELEK